MHHDDTPEADRALLGGKNSEEVLETRHYFNEKSGRLDKVKYAQSHSAAVSGAFWGAFDVPSHPLRTHPSSTGCFASPAACMQCVPAAIRSHISERLITHS